MNAGSLLSDFRGADFGVLEVFFFLFRDGDLNKESTAWQFLFVVFRAFDPDLPLMRLDDTRRDGETQARSTALEFSAARRMQFHLAKLI